MATKTGVALLLPALVGGCISGRGHGLPRQTGSVLAKPRPTGAATLEGLVGQTGSVRRDDGPVDLVRAVALLAREQDPGLDPALVEALIERKAQTVREDLRQVAGARGRPSSAEAARLVIAFANRRVLAGLKPYAGTVLANTPDDLNVAHILRTRRGTCIGFTALYLAVAQRAGLPFHGVYTHRHVFVRFDDGHIRRNIETTAGGRSLADAHYVRAFKLHPERVRQGLALRNLTPREFLAHLLTAYGAALDSPRLKDSRLKPSEPSEPRAGRFLRLAVRIDPHNATALHNLGAYLYGRGDLAAARQALDAALAADPFLPDSYLARSHLRRKARQFEGALADAEAAVALEETSVPARLARAELYGLQGRLEAAAADCRAILARTRTEHRAWYLMARIQALAGHPRRALADLRQAVRYGARDFAQMRRLKDFASLHGEPRFRKLVGLRPGSGLEK